MEQLFRMRIRLEMDREVLDGHYVAPGGFECNGKPFDFFESSREAVPGYPNQVEFCLSEYDESLGEEDETYVNRKDVEKEWGEFYIYTGEKSDPEIVPVRALEVEFEFYNEDKDRLTSVVASPKVLENINACIKEQVELEHPDEEIEI